MEEQNVDGSKLTDDELVTQAIMLGFDWHYPGRIRIGQILEEHFGCDYRRRFIIGQQIVEYGIARYADESESDLLVNPTQAKAIQSGNPIEYMKKWRAEQKPKPSVWAQNSIVGDNNSGNNVGQGRDFLNSASPIVNTAAQQAHPKQKAEITNHTIWDKIKYISGIIVGLGGLAAAVVAVGKHFGWW